MNLNVKRERSINDFLMQKLPAEEKKSAIPALNLFTIVRYFFLSLNSEKLPPLLSLLPASSLLLVLFSILWLCLYALDSSCEWSLMDLCVRRVESSSSVIRCRISSSWFLKKNIFQAIIHHCHSWLEYLFKPFFSFIIISIHRLVVVDLHPRINSFSLAFVCLFFLNTKRDSLASQTQL